jgi:hypothetical protein
MKSKRDKAGWRKQGEPALPNLKTVEPRAKTRAPKDPTYGAEDDMLSRPGVIVEPDVRRKIASYFKKMKLREVIREILIDEEIRSYSE